MEKGELDIRPIPKLVLVFEGALGILLPKNARQYKRAVKWNNWKKAVSLWDIDPLMEAQIERVFWNQNRSIRVVTYLGADFGQELQLVLEDRELPVEVTWEDFDVYRRTVGYKPDVAAVYDANPDHVFSYGVKGRHLTSVHQFGRI